MHLMVNQAKEKIQVELLRHLYREELMAEVRRPIRVGPPHCCARLTCGSYRAGFQ